MFLSCLVSSLQSLNMKTCILSLFDSAANFYAAPFTVPSTAVAVRSLKAAIDGDSGDVAKHPEDFTLYKIGEFDSESGKITAFDTPERVVRAIDLKSPSV